MVGAGKEQGRAGISSLRVRGTPGRLMPLHPTVPSDPTETQHAVSACKPTAAQNHLRAQVGRKGTRNGRNSVSVSVGRLPKLRQADFFLLPFSLLLKFTKVFYLIF